MAPKDLYYLPQVFIVTKDGSKEEFAGITQFWLDTESGAVYDNNMMYHSTSPMMRSFMRPKHTDKDVTMPAPGVNKATWLDQGKAVPK
jgi:hypothetical protein